ncbi:hypothetical protein [Xanthomonas hortorum]|uniref:hypothetical protein n=1 Tax=Xanthomonas hortorum TaxID=56454 RepID=UPI000CEDFB70|nr:hypothetical protein XhhCFBP4925_09240 [Xanthomonas hortorum pv. hederae]PUF00360.1 hypothetical protein C7T87_08725 [Xanthomonas hortorum pv. hederae]
MHAIAPWFGAVIQRVGLAMERGTSDSRRYDRRRNLTLGADPGEMEWREVLVLSTADVCIPHLPAGVRCPARR